MCVLFFLPAGRLARFYWFVAVFLSCYFFSPLSLMSSRFLSLFGLMLYDVELYFFLNEHNKSRKTSDLVFFLLLLTH